MQPLSTSLMNMSLVLRLPRQIHPCRCSSNAPHLPLFWMCYKTLTFCSLLAGCRIPCACLTKQRFNVQKWREHVVLAFWLRNVLRATTACTFSTSELPKVLWMWGAFSFFTCKCASRHSSVQFFIFHLPKWMAKDPLLERSYFSTLRSHKSLEKHSESRLFGLFPHLQLLSSDSFSSLIFSLLLFSSLLRLFPPLLCHLSILSEVWLLNFLRT